MVAGVKGITRVYETHQPAMRYGEFFEDLSKVINSGVVEEGKMTLKALIYVSVLWTKYKDEIRSVNPPYPVMVLLGFIGRLLDYAHSHSPCRDPLWYEF